MAGAYDEEEDRLTVVESLCVSCGENGTTRLLLTSIPHFKEIVLSSFECRHCGYRNNDVMPAGSLKPQGVRMKLCVKTTGDLNRQIVKSEYATVRIPDLDFEIPPNTQRGLCTTIQGIITQACSALEASSENNPMLTERITDFVQKLRKLVDDSGPDSFTPFTLELIDPSGNSNIEALEIPPKIDPLLEISSFNRTKEQLHAMGYYEDQGDETGTADETATAHETVTAITDLPEKLSAGETWDLCKTIESNLEERKNEEDSMIEFVSECAHCGNKSATEKMCELNVPGFKKCIVMSYNCDKCGARSNEVKPAGSIGPRGVKWTLKITDIDDLNRDILKSDFATLEIPEAECSLEPGTLGGVFTTVEGLLRKVADNLADSCPFLMGDSATQSDVKDKLNQVITKLTKAADGESLPFTLILDDPADQSHIGKRNADDEENDSRLSKQAYDRTDQQNDELGLNDMKV